MYKFDWRDYLDRNNRAILDLGITEDMLEDIPDQLIRAFIYRKYRSISDNPQVYFAYRDKEFNFYSTRLRNLTPQLQIFAMYEFFICESLYISGWRNFVDYFLDMNDEGLEKYVKQYMTKLIENWVKFSTDYCENAFNDSYKHKSFFDEFHLKMDLTHERKRLFEQQPLYFFTHFGKLFKLFMKYFFGAYPEFDKHGGIYTERKINPKENFYKNVTQEKFNRESNSYIPDKNVIITSETKDSMQLMQDVEARIPSNEVRKKYEKNKMQESSFNWIRSIQNLINTYGDNHYYHDQEHIMYAVLSFAIENINGGGQLYENTFKQIQSIYEQSPN